MTPTADTTTCYICNDKRRTAYTDASTTPTGPHADSATLKQTLIRALSHGHAEDLTSGGEDEFGLTSGVCVVSLSSRYDGGLEAVSDRVAGDQVVICRRCTGLLKDFEHHEQTAARKAEEIRRFLMRQMQFEEEEKGSGGSATHSHSLQDSMKKIMARSQDERQGIIAAFRAFRKSGMREARGKGRKRKKESGSSDTNYEKDNDDDDDDDDDDDEMEEIIQEENVKEEEERRKQEIASARHSERIQRRREDGLVMRWGDTVFENEDDMKLLEGEEDLFDYSPSVLLKGRSYARRGRGKKLTRVVRSAAPTVKNEDDTGFKFQCPFCFRFYTPMSSRIHNCTSYKNQLRCQVCNIFFTSYVRLEKHLEVIHLQQKQLTCPTDGCSFTCIAEPTLTIHKHFHVLESFTGEGEDKEVRGARKAEFNQRRKESMQGRGRHEEVTVQDDEEGVASSPEIADRVSFLIDEKSFLSDGHPLNITMDRTSKDAEEEHKVLRLQGSDRSQAKRLSPNLSVESGALTPEKDERKSPKGSNLVLQCPICDVTLVSTRSYQEHIRDIHNLRVMTKIVGEDSLSRELPQKGSSSESLMRIVKYYNVKKKLQRHSEGHGLRREGEKGSKQDAESKSLAASYGDSKEGSNLEYVWKPLSFDDKEEFHTSEEEQVAEKKNKDGKKSHQCPTCAKSFPSRAHLKEHEIGHSSAQQYQCSVCGQGFKRKNALSKHMRIFHPDGPGSVVCSCGKVFASKELMERHKESSGQHRLLVCGECGAMYKTQANLESHLLLHQETQAGGDAWPHTCHTCQERFSSRASLSNHTRDIHSTSVITCPECSKTFRTPKQLRLHRLRRHTAGDREFLCPLCSKAFHVLKDLRRHMQTHNPAGTHECPVCHSKFKTESTLRSHMKSNSKGKPYDCSICLFPCCTLEALREHLLSCHSVQDVGSDFSTTWNSKCLVCGQVFLRRSVLAQHMRTHFGPEDTQLVVLEDAEVDIAQNSLFQQDFPEVGQVAARQTRLGKVKAKASPHHETPTQAEPNLMKPREESLSEDVDEGSKDSQTAATPAQTDTGNKTLPDTDNDRQTDSRGQEEEAGSSVWGEKNAGAMEAPGVGGVVAASSSSGVEGEETRYICEACSLVLTDMEELKVHLLTCYKEDSSDECFVVFEVDEDDKVQ